MVQRDQCGTYRGAKKIIFLIRDIDGPAMTGASVESCRFVVLRSPGVRLGTVLDVGNRLRRMRGRFDRWIHISTGPQPLIGLEHKSANFSIQSSLGAPSAGACGPGDYPTSDLSQRASASRSTSEKSK